MEMIEADSPGRYFAQNIKPNHEATLVDDGVATEDDRR